ncbi:MAG: hypothetical protein JW809_19000 [Pirellulales bacterium]|nr:hypothetical protein [Pirellulales bacterium]
MSSTACNPYAAPYDNPPEGGRLDREARSGLADAIRQFLDEKKSAFAFDEALDAFRDSSDPTVRHIAQAAWYHYDDCQDHMVTLSKPQWDYFQRMLLVLESDRQIEVASVRRWCWTQWAALACLAGFGWCVWRFGWGMHLLAFSMPFGLVSIAISLVRRWRVRRAAFDAILVPFASFGELSAAYRATPSFAKRRYPRTLAGRRIRSPLAAFGVGLQLYATWLMFAPIPLLVQTLPLKEMRTRVKEE